MAQDSRTVAGYVANDPKEITTANNKQLVVFRVIENSRYFDRDAREWRDGEAVSYDVAVGQDQLRANVLASLQKGQRVQVEGNYQPKAYLDREGNPQVGHQVWAKDVAASMLHETQQRGEPAVDAAGRDVGVSREARGRDYTVASQEGAVIAQVEHHDIYSDSPEAHQFDAHGPEVSR